MYLLLRFAASYTSKETANQEQPLVDLATVPSVEAHRMPDGNIHPVQVEIRTALFKSA